MKIGPYDLPDTCPEDCAFHNQPQALMQGGPCHRCPVTNCTPFEYEGETMCLVEPSDYRLDWAREWDEFFRTGRPPALRLQKEPPS